MADSEKWYETSLRLSGDSLPVERVQALLGFPPDYIGSKGSHIRGNPRYAKHDTNIWHYRFTTDTKDAFEGQLARAVTRLETVREGLRGLLDVSGVRGELFLGFGSGNGQGGFAISPDLLSRIGALGLTVSVDLYPPDVDEVKGGHSVERTT